MMQHGKTPSAVDGCYNRCLKRILDILMALLLLLLLWPLLLITAAAVAADSGFPVLYRGRRSGLHNKPFYVYKFRTMVRNAEKAGGDTTSLDDKRVTRIGRILRKTKLDELPQLFNVLGGTMSIIGPRPELPYYTSRYTAEERIIMEVRPGITDYSSLQFINLSEVVGRDHADEVYEEHVLPIKNKLRMKYVKELSFLTDARILAATASMVLRRIL